LNRYNVKLFSVEDLLNEGKFAKNRIDIEVKNFHFVYMLRTEAIKFVGPSLRSLVELWIFILTETIGKKVKLTLFDKLLL
jgi:hypothetical protein